jgi:peptidoglycan/LPS O-acetylase OafA/YrhL
MTTKAPSAKNSAVVDREPLLDWLRGLAATWVVLHHLWQMRTGHVVYSAYDRIGELGWLGVPVFFVISGYCISKVADRVQAPIAFGVQRLLRIFPAYWMSLFLIYLIAAVRVLVAGANDMMQNLASSPLEFLMQATLLYEPVTALKPPNWVYWTLVYEVAFYLVVSAALVAPKRLLITLLAISCLSLMVFLHRVPGLFFLDHWGLFALGFGLDRLIRKKDGLLVPLALMLTAAISAAALERYEASLVGLATAVMIWAFSRRTASLDVRPLRYLGQWSYSLYLLHVPVCVIVLRGIVGYVSAPLVETWQVVLYDAGAIAFGAAAAGISFYAVESPGIRIGKMLSRRISKAPRIAPGGAPVNP